MTRSAQTIRRQSMMRFNGALAALLVVTSAAMGVIVIRLSHAAVTWPTTPPAQICGNATYLSGPAVAPGGATTVPAGNNSAINFGQAGVTYWFAPGTHTLNTGQFNQITPGNNATFVGAPGAIFDGQHSNYYAFTQHATGVTVKYLTIQNFGVVGGNNNEGVVNHDAGHNWTITNNTVIGNAGAGVFVGSGDIVSYNCLQDNGQYGFSAYEPSVITNVTLDHNEIVGNDTYDWETHSPGCGCTGGGKFWNTKDATITNNYVHDNHSVGIWADTNNIGFQVENNYISDNVGQGFFYEISYNALVRNNNFLRNGLVAGPANSGFPTGAIYLSESGGDGRVANTHGYSTIDISGNNFQDNWSGVVGWENADRYCNSPANTSSGTCTLVNPAVTTSTCVAGTINSAPNYSDCRWKTQNVSVHDNVFSINKPSISGCAAATSSCGISGLFSNYGTYPNWSPYQGTVIEQAITSSQNNHFSNNTYQGDWHFMPHDQGVVVTFAQWQGSPYAQDAGSSFNGSLPVTTPTPVPTVAPTPTPVPGAAATPAPTVGPGATATPTPTATPTSGILNLPKGDGKTVVKVDGVPIAADGKLDTTTLTNGTHTVTITDASGKTTTQTIAVSNNLPWWQALRNQLFAPFKGNVVAMNIALGTLALVGLGALSFGVWRLWLIRKS